MSCLHPLTARFLQNTTEKPFPTRKVTIPKSTITIDNCPHGAGRKLFRLRLATISQNYNQRQSITKHLIMKPTIVLVASSTLAADAALSTMRVGPRKRSHIAGQSFEFGRPVDFDDANAA